MKRLLILFVIVFSTVNLQAQFKVGGNVGVPVSNNSDLFSLSAGLDLYYMFGETKDGFLKFGVTTGIINYFAKDLDTESRDDAQIIPVAFATRINLLKTLTVGADLGAGVGLNIPDEGGPYARFVAGVELGDALEINAQYNLIKIIKGADFASVGMGLLVKF